MSTRLRIPKYRHHKARNQAVVRLDGKDRYLGPYNSPPSWEKYHRLVAEHISRGGAPVIPTAPDKPLTVQRLTLAYTDYAESYYLKDGQLTSEVGCIEAALRPLLKLYAETPAAEFGPKALKLVREEFIRKGLTRGTVNHQVFRIRRMFRWATENEILPVTVYQALMFVSSLPSKIAADAAKQSRTTSIHDRNYLAHATCRTTLRPFNGSWPRGVERRSFGTGDGWPNARRLLADYTLIVKRDAPPIGRRVQFSD